MTSLNYDKLAEDYGRFRSCHPGVLSELASAVSTIGSARVAEVGAGTANYAGALEAITACTCWAVEPSRAMLDIAVSRYPNLRVVTGSAEALPLDAESFHFVYCVDVIHHVGRPEAFLSEAHRALEPGGTLCIVTDSEEIIRNRDLARKPLNLVSRYALLWATK